MTRVFYSLIGNLCIVMLLSGASAIEARAQQRSPDTPEWFRATRSGDMAMAKHLKAIRTCYPEDHKCVFMATDGEMTAEWSPAGTTGNFSSMRIPSPLGIRTFPTIWPYCVLVGNWSDSEENGWPRGKAWINMLTGAVMPFYRSTNGCYPDD